MLITAVGHATYLVQSGSSAVLSDPVFFECAESDASCPYPARGVSIPRLPLLTGVFLSHRHFDHFDVRSLAQIDRTTPIAFPAGDALIASALTGLGFTRQRPLAPWETVRFGEIEILATPSRVSWPELGMVFRAQGATMWNLVDSVIDQQVIAAVRERVGSIGCLLSHYTPTLQYVLRNGLAERELDVERYAEIVATVLAIAPHIVVPSAVALSFVHGLWQDGYAFPITPQRFCSDIAAAAPEMHALPLDPGDVLDLRADGFERLQQAARFVSIRPGFDGYARRHHDPARGVPRFVDHNPLRSPADEALRFARRYIEQQLLLDVQHPSNARSFSDWRAWKLRWRLDLHAPAELGVEPVSFGVDFAVQQPRLELDVAWDAGLRTSVTATGLYDVLHQRCSAFAYLFADRTRHSQRVFELTAAGFRRPERPLTEPLFAALAGPRQLDRAFVAAQVEQWAAPRAASAVATARS
jgi:UDP-MurNAc hydroxylase